MIYHNINGAPMMAIQTDRAWSPHQSEVQHLMAGGQRGVGKKDWDWDWGAKKYICTYICFNNTPYVAHECAIGSPMSGTLPISIGNNSILDLAYLFRPKPLPKSKFGLAFGRMRKSNNFLATHSDYLSDYFQAGLSNSGIVFVAMQEELLKSNLGNNCLPQGNC